MSSPVRLLAAAVACFGVCASCLTLGVAGLMGRTDVSGPAGSSGATAVGDTPVSPGAEVALAWAMGRVGTPYLWGGVGPRGFDCSGLTQAAYRAAGVMLPRVAQQQFDAGPHVDAGAPLHPGDLVFFGSSRAAVDHVGMALGQGDMVDAPHRGASVQIERIWSNGYVGATRPAG